MPLVPLGVNVNRSVRPPSRPAGDSHVAGRVGMRCRLG
jgi:hypothetical protein